MRSRLIAEDIWKDGFIGSLSFFERLVWIGLITTVDDQGRMLDNPIILQAGVFPYDRNITPDKITAALEKIVKAGKVMPYEAEGKSLLQIVNWWHYQNPQWPQPSRHPAPPGWIDRVKRRGAGGKVEMLNWDQPGGFRRSPQPPVIPIATPKPIGMVVPMGIPLQKYVEEEGEVEVEDNDGPVLSPLSAAFVNESHIPELTGGVEKWVQALEKLKKAGVEPEDIVQAVREMQAKGYQIVSLGSIVTPAIVQMSKRNGNRPQSLEEQGVSYVGK